VATRQLLLTAATECLVERGVARFTTTEVCKRAGVSQGALFKHFPTKADLWAATIDERFALLRSDWESAFAATSPADRTPATGIELLWAEMHDPRLAAAFELYTAARTDEELQAALEPIVRAHVALIEELSRQAVPAPTDPGTYAAMVDLVVFAMQGLVVQQMAVPEPERAERLRATLHSLAGLLGPGA